MDPLLVEIQHLYGLAVLLFIQVLKGNKVLHISPNSEVKNALLRPLVRYGVHIGVVDCLADFTLDVLPLKHVRVLIMESSFLFLQPLLNTPNMQESH